ncbi:MAG: M24 family metallopeptidase [Chloroflexi bacterium]|nr:M24 family metallopeptidase [Chloroflexota bacterium]
MRTPEELDRYARYMEARATPAEGTTVWVWNGYSLAERDRRWNAVRQQGRDAGFDCIVIPIGNGTDSRYMTHLRVASMVLPTDGREPIVISDRGSTNDWIPAPRYTQRAWGPPTAEALLDLGMERARIGVVGLKAGKVTHVRAPGGIANYTAFQQVLDHLPNATFEDATDVLGFVRYVKSDEEIDCLRRSAAMAEAGIDQMIEVAKPGVDLAVLYAAVMERILTLGSESYNLAITCDAIDSPNPVRHTNPPIGRRLRPNDLITNETSAVWGAEVAQEDQPILLGQIPDAWRPVIELQQEVFAAGLSYMTPGRAFGEFIDLVNGFGEPRGMRTLTLLHGRGYGDDGPLITPSDRGDDIRDVRMEKGNAFVWKPYAMSADGAIRFVWGGDVIVTDTGGEVLFKRPHGMVTVQ